MAHFDALNWPTPASRSILQMRQEARDEEESKGGAIRADTEGLRVRRRDDKRDCPQVGGAPPDGAPGTGGCTAAGAQADPTRAAGGGAADCLYRRHPGR